MHIYSKCVCLKNLLIFYDFLMTTKRKFRGYDKPGNYKMSERALDFNFKGWRTNLKFTVSQAAVFLGVSYDLYSKWEKYGRASSLTSVLLARHIDNLYEMKKVSPESFQAYLEAWARVILCSGAEIDTHRSAKVVRAEQRAKRLAQQPQNQETRMV